MAGNLKTDNKFLKIQRKTLQKELEILRLGHTSKIKQIEMYRKQFYDRNTRLDNDMRNKESYLRGSEIGVVESMIHPEDLDRYTTSPSIYNRIKSADKHFKERPESGRRSVAKRRVKSAPTKREETKTPLSERRDAEYYSCHRPKTANTFFARKNNEEDLRKFREELIEIEKAKRPILQNKVESFAKIFQDMKETGGYFNRDCDMEDVAKNLDEAYFRIHQKYPTRRAEEVAH